MSRRFSSAFIAIYGIVTFELYSLQCRMWISHFTQSDTCGQNFWVIYSSEKIKTFYFSIFLLPQWIWDKGKSLFVLRVVFSFENFHIRFEIVAWRLNTEWDFSLSMWEFYTDIWHLSQCTILVWKQKNSLGRYIFSFCKKNSVRFYLK